MRQLNRRQRTLLLLLLTLSVLLAVTLAGALLTQRATETDFSRMNRSPSLTFLFGTDWMGRDMLARTLAGLSLSIRIGVLTALVSAVIALLCGVAAALSRRADAVLSWCIDLFLGIPHILGASTCFWASPTFCWSCSSPWPLAGVFSGWWPGCP